MKVNQRIAKSLKVTCGLEIAVLTGAMILCSLLTASGEGGDCDFGLDMRNAYHVYLEPSYSDILFGSGSSGDKKAAAHIEGRVHQIDVSAQNAELAAAADLVLYTWHVAANGYLSQSNCINLPNCTAISICHSPSGQTIAAGDEQGNLHIIQHGHEVRSIPVFTNQAKDQVSSIAFIEETRVAAAGSGSPTVYVVNIDGNIEGSFGGLPNNGVSSLSANPSKGFLVVGGTFGEVACCSNYTRIWSTNVAGSNAKVAFSPDGDRIAAESSPNPAIHVFRVQDGTECPAGTGVGGSVIRLRFWRDPGTGWTVSSAVKDATAFLEKVPACPDIQRRKQ